MLTQQLKDQFLDFSNKIVNVPLSDENSSSLWSGCMAEFSHLMLLYCSQNEIAFKDFHKVIKKANESLNRKTRGGNKEVKAIIFSSIALLLQRESLKYS